MVRVPYHGWMAPGRVIATIEPRLEGAGGFVDGKGCSSLELSMGFL